MQKNVISFPEPAKPQHDTAERHSRVSFQIGAQRYLFEFTGRVIRIPSTSATLIAISGARTNPLRRRRAQNRARVSQGNRAYE